jgi:hypothetical protein
MWIILGIIFYWRIVTALEYRKDDDDMVAHHSTIFVATATIDNCVLMKGSGHLLCRYLHVHEINMRMSLLFSSTLIVSVTLRTYQNVL